MGKRTETAAMTLVKLRHPHNTPAREMHIATEEAQSKEEERKPPPTDDPVLAFLRTCQPPLPQETEGEVHQVFNEHLVKREHLVMLKDEDKQTIKAYLQEMGLERIGVILRLIKAIKDIRPLD